jgi:tRNA(adenine34) deaminase
MDYLESYMPGAIDEAMISLREGNHGFGTIIVKENTIIAKAHDEEESNNDPTSHAEINAIKTASKITGKDLKGCILISTHEPCPMCSSAIVWSGINHIAFGYPIGESIEQGRNRIDLTCEEVFRRAGKAIRIDKNILHYRCEVLYRRDVRNEIKRLRKISDEKLSEYNEDSVNRRIEWFNKNRSSFTFINDNLLESAYNLLLCRFNIDKSEAPITEQSRDHITFHSMNFCPTLEACKILNLDTRYICKRYNENSTDTLIKQIDKRLNFSRNYEKLRPHTDYCEEMIRLNNNKSK